MKKVAWIILAVLPLLMYAQPERDNLRDVKWMLGFASNDGTYPDFGNTLIDFNQQPMSVSGIYTTMNFFETNTSVSDTAGNLLFYTNGFSLYDSTHQPMAGWDTLNPGYIASQWFPFGHRNLQGTLILPQPGNDSLYYVIHNSYDLFPEIDGYYAGNALYYSVVNMRENNGLGAIIALNQVLLSEMLDYGKVNACRHANGRDWWIIMATYNDKFYHLFLLTPQGVQYKGQQIVTTPVIIGAGQSVFSPDGNMFVVYQAVKVNGGKYIHIYDFDRCLGALQEKAYITLNDTAVGAGAAISPNSRFLYIMSYWKIYQFDLWAADIAATQTTVAVWDGFADDGIYSTTFNLGQLGPDGKIYVSSRSLNGRYLHVVENPNEAGTACNVAQHSLQLPHHNGVSMPHFPYFRLGAVAGSACDSLGLGYAVGVSPSLNPPLASEGGSLGVVVYPNPATQYSHLYFGRALEAGYRLAVYDVVGRLAHEAALSIACVGYTLSVQDWSAGLYVAVLYAPDGTVAASAKIVVER